MVGKYILGYAFLKLKEFRIVLPNEDFLVVFTSMSVERYRKGTRTNYKFPRSIVVNFE